MWNHEGDRDAITFNVRRVPDSDGLTLCLVCGELCFHAAYCAPGPDWTRISVPRGEVGCSWGARSHDEKVFDPTRVTKLSFGHDDVIAFDLDHVALDVRETMLLGFADADVDGNLFSPGDRPTVRVEVVSTFRTPQEAKLELELAVVHDCDHTRYEWLPPWEYAGQLTPTVGRAFGFNFVLLDAGKPGESMRYWIGLTPGICGGKDPSRLQTFVLAE